MSGRKKPSQVEFEGMEIPRDELITMAAEQSQRVDYLDLKHKEVSLLRRSETARLAQMNAALYRSVELPEVHLSLGDFEPPAEPEAEE